MRLATAIEWHCLSALGYTTAVMACAGDGGGPVTFLMNDWIAATGRVSDAALFLLPTPPDGTASAMYRHILSANIVISGVWLWFSKSYWAHWATEFRKIYGTSKHLSHKLRRPIRDGGGRAGHIHFTFRFSAEFLPRFVPRSLLQAESST